MSVCKNCNNELIQTEGKRPKEYCDNTCRSAYFRKNKVKEPKYVQFKTFQALKEKLDAAIAENNKPENKARILKERNTPSPASEKHTKSRPLPVDECIPGIQEELEKELDGIKGASGVADMRRKLLRKKIAEIKAKLSI